MYVEYKAIVKGTINIPNEELEERESESSLDGIIGEYIFNDLAQNEVEGFLTDMIDDVDYNIL